MTSTAPYIACKIKAPRIGNMKNVSFLNMLPLVKSDMSSIVNNLRYLSDYVHKPNPLNAFVFHAIIITGRSMKKIILTAFAVLTLLTGCNYDPYALMYGETRHIGIIEGRYTARCKGLIYEFVFAEEPEKNKEVQMTLNVYNEPQF